MRRRFQWLGGVFLSACLIAPLLHARVYAIRHIDLFSPASYGRLIYKTLMEINGGKAEVNVVACEGDLTPLRAIMSAHADPSLRFVAIQPGAEKPALLVTVLQSQAERDASQSSYARHRLVDVPVPQDGIVRSTMNSGDTRTTFERISSRMARVDVVRFIEQGLERNGWKKQVGAGEESGFLVYIKGSDICLVLVKAKESDGETSITLLHKQGAVN